MLVLPRGFAATMANFHQSCAEPRRAHGVLLDLYANTPWRVAQKRQAEMDCEEAAAESDFEDEVADDR